MIRFMPDGSSFHERYDVEGRYVPDDSPEAMERVHSSLGGRRPPRPPRRRVHSMSCRRMAVILFLIALMITLILLFLVLMQHMTTHTGMAVTPALLLMFWRPPFPRPHRGPNPDQPDWENWNRSSWEREHTSQMRPYQSPTPIHKIQCGPMFWILVTIMCIAGIVFALAITGVIHW